MGLKGNKTLLSGKTTSAGRVLRAIQDGLSGQAGAMRREKYELETTTHTAATAPPVRVFTITSHCPHRSDGLRAFPAARDEQATNRPENRRKRASRNCLTRTVPYAHCNLRSGPFGVKTIR